TDVDTASYCGQYDTVTAGDYTLDLDQWGLSDADSGTDCAQITSQSGSTIAWTATWAWTGSTSVVAYTNVNLNTGIGVQLSEVTSIPTTWSWSSNITSSSVADVAYDMFTSSTADGSNEYEIMVWLSNVNSEPIASSYDSSGDAEAAETNLSIAGQTWDLYSGSNGSNEVYSFLLSSGEDLTDFDGDLLEFFTYLIDNESLSSSQYIITLQAGTEETSGSATLTTYVLKWYAVVCRCLMYHTAGLLIVFLLIHRSRRFLIYWLTCSFFQCFESKWTRFVVLE
ncbi:glycoside hydrolase family 12 protein, partial [Fistulina hepatica ATCC 64428]